MSAQPAPSGRHLRLIDENGEFVPSPKLDELNAELEKLRGDLKAAERDLRAKRRRITELERDRVRERIDHPDREFIRRVCHYWWAKARPEDYQGRRRINPMSDDRFDAVAALAELQEIVVVDGKRQRAWKYGAEHFKAAVDGAVFDPFVITYKNGKRKPQNDLEQICRSVSKFERCMDKAPYEVVPILPARPTPDEVAQGAANCENRAGFQPPRRAIAGNGKQQEGSYGSERPLGAPHRGAHVPLEAGWLHAPCGVGFGYPRASSEVAR